MRVSLHTLRMLTRSRTDQLDTSHAKGWLQVLVHRLNIIKNLLNIVSMSIVSRPNKAMPAAKTTFICFNLDPKSIHYIACPGAATNQSVRCIKMAEFEPNAN
jgi:hypothetical protein